MSTLEKNLHEVRKQINEAIHQLAETAIEDSSTYKEAIKNLNAYRWNLMGGISTTMIDAAIEKVKDRALMSEIKRDC